MRHQPERLVVGMRRKGGARRPGLLAPDFLTILLQDGLRLGSQQRDLVFGEAAGHEQVSLLIEKAKLLGGELHGLLLEIVATSIGLCRTSIYRVCAKISSGSARLLFVPLMADTTEFHWWQKEPALAGAALAH
jgi:hypothetical protein